jgi:hypothetical protein
MVFTHAQSTDLADAFFMMLHADHPDDFFVRKLSDKEVIAGRFHVRRFDVVDVQTGIVLGDLSADHSFDVKLSARREIARAEAADGGLDVIG